jgi:hypothetical protein
VSLSQRDRRAVTLLGAAVILAGAYYFWPGNPPAPAAAGVQTVDQAEKRLARLRETAASAPSRESVLQEVGAQLAAREKGLIQAETAAQVQAQLLQMVRRLASAESVPIEIRTTEIGAVAPFGDVYGSVNISIQIECTIEQLINLMAAISAQPELVATSDLRVTSSSPKNKVVGVRLTLTALVPRKLVPERKGPAAL